MEEKEALEREIERLKKKVESLAIAVRMFLKRSVMVNGVPLNMTLPRQDFKAERAARALQELSDGAALNGTSEMTLEEINSEISAVRNG